MRRFHRSRRTSRSKGRKLIWDGVQVMGPVELGGLGNEQQYLFWTKWPAGARETLDETGINRSGELLSLDETLVRTRVIWNFAVATDIAPSVYNIALGITTWENNEPEIYDNIVQSGGGFLGGPNQNPDPIVDLGEDWVFRSTVGYTPNVPNVETFFSTGGADVDSYQSRAMRKLSAGKGLICVVSATGDTASMDSVLNFRMQLEVRQLFKSGVHR